MFGKVMAIERTSVPFTLESYNEVFVPTSSGAIAITPETALQIAAVYACVTIIGETIGSVPLDVFERTEGDGKRMAREHELYDVLHEQPNEYQTALEFREMMTAFALLRDRGVAEHIPGTRRRPPQLKPLHPDLVTRETTQDGVIRYRYQDPILKRERVLLSDEVFVLNARFGRSVLTYARESFGLARTFDRYASEFLTRGAKASGALQHPKKLSPKARRALREALNKYQVGGVHSGRPLLLEEGMTWQSISITNKDAEFLESRKFSVAEIARWFRVPPHKLQDLERATNNNIELQSVEFVTDTIRPWAERWEQSIRRDLIDDVARFFAEHNLEGLHRGDIKTRYEAYAIGRQWGWLATNDIRRKENLDPIDGGDDDYLTPLNMTTDGRPAAFLVGGKHSGALAQLRAMARDAAGRAARKETASIAKLAERTAAAGDEWTEGVRAFYREHTGFVARLLHLPEEVAAAWAAGRAHAVLDNGPAALEDDEVDRITELTDMALSQAEVLRLPAAAA